jgi:hypothetical protein
MAKDERDTHFHGFAKLLFQEMLDACNGHIDIRANETLARWEFEEAIARRAYDLLQSACIDINNAQVKQGVRLSPRAMLRAVADLTEWPPTKDDTQ